MANLLLLIPMGLLCVFLDHIWIPPLFFGHKFSYIFYYLGLDGQECVFCYIPTITFISPLTRSTHNGYDLMSLAFI